MPPPGFRSERLNLPLLPRQYQTIGLPCSSSISINISFPYLLRRCVRSITRMRPIPAAKGIERTSEVSPTFGDVAYIQRIIANIQRIIALIQRILASVQCIKHLIQKMLASVQCIKHLIQKMLAFVQCIKHLIQKMLASVQCIKDLIQKMLASVQCIKALIQIMLVLSNCINALRQVIVARLPLGSQPNPRKQNVPLSQHPIFASPAVR